jgi:transposase-like protein
VARRQHVAVLEKLAAENDGRIPSTRWLIEHGYEASYDFLRQYPDAFAHLKRTPRVCIVKPLREKPVRVKPVRVKPVRIKPVRIERPEAERVAQDAQIVAMYQSGASIRKIAEELRCSFTPVQRALKSAAVVPRHCGRARVVTPEAEQALALYKSGLKPAQIAETLGIKSNWRMERVRRLLKAVGVDLPLQRLERAQWNAMQQEQIAALYANGASVHALVAKFGYAHRICPLLKAAGVFQPYRDNIRKPTCINQIESIRDREFYQQVLGFYKHGMAITDVAMHFGYRRGCGCNRVRRVLVRAGLHQIKQKPRQGGAAVVDRIDAISSSESGHHPAA